MKRNVIGKWTVAAAAVGVMPYIRMPTGSDGIGAGLSNDAGDFSPFLGMRVGF